MCVYVYFGRNDTVAWNRGCARCRVTTKAEAEHEEGTLDSSLEL
jgi:hypothetical protein